MDFWNIFIIFDWGLFLFTAGTVLYLAIFAIASFIKHTHEQPRTKKQNRIVVLIPSFKQDNVIEQAVISVLSQAYPQRMFDVTVISDHQSEMTNMRLAQYPITLLTPNFAESTKAKSLQYAILNLPEFKIYDIVLILDADNIIEQNYLQKVNEAFEIAARRNQQCYFPPGAHPPRIVFRFGRFWNCLRFHLVQDQRHESKNGWRGQRVGSSSIKTRSIY